MMIQVAKPLVGEKELQEVARVFQTGWLGMGNKVFEFEKALGKMFKGRNVVATSTGTIALHLALDALGVGPGDEVIVPSLTFIGTIQPIVQCGARPVFCDVSRTDLNMSVPHLKKLITRRTRVIMPVHYGGQPCAMDAINRIARAKKLRVVEDAAHAFGSRYKGKPVGSFGDIACFSFDPIKNLTCGEGGAVVCRDRRLADILVKKRILGIDKDTWNRYKNERSWFYEVQLKGYRYHMSNISAAIGLAQLRRFKQFSRRRQMIGASYDRAFRSMKGVRILKHSFREIVPFNYTILVDDRNALMAFLTKKGVGTVINYIPNHIQPLFTRSRGCLPNTDWAYERMVSIPVHAGMTMSDARKVVSAIKKFYKGT